MRDSDEVLQKQFNSQVKALGPLMDKYQREVAAEYGMTDAQLHEISREGVMNNWALPPIRDE